MQNLSNKRVKFNQDVEQAEFEKISSEDEISYLIEDSNKNDSQNNQSSGSQRSQSSNEDGEDNESNFENICSDEEEYENGNFLEYIK